jgi:hypothetical protein
VTTEPLHLVEVGLAWPADTFLRDKLKGLAKRGVRVTVVAAARRGPDESPPGIDVVRLPDTSARPLWLALTGAVDCARLVVTDRPRLGRVLAATARLTRGRRLRERLGWLRIFARVESLRPSVVHFEWESAAVRFLPLVDFWGCPMVMSCHGGLDLYSQSATHRRALDGLQQAFDRAAAVHCVSEAMRAEATRHGLDPSKAWVIRSGVELGVFTPSRS